MPRKVSHNFDQDSKYDWDGWELDKSPKEFVQGEDFTCEIESFRVSVYVAAKKRGMKARTALTDTGIIVQFVPLEGKKTASQKRPTKKRPAKKRK